MFALRLLLLALVASCAPPLTLAPLPGTHPANPNAPEAPPLAMHTLGPTDTATPGNTNPSQPAGAPHHGGHHAH